MGRDPVAVPLLRANPPWRKPGVRWRMLRRGRHWATLARQKICLSKFSGKSRRRRRLGEQPARLLTHARMSAIAVQVSYPATIELDD